MPTLAEAGYPGVGTLHWQSMLAPANTPKETLATLFKAIVEASKVPALQEGFAKQLVSVKPSESLDEVAGLAQERARELAQDHLRGEDRPDRLMPWLSPPRKRGSTIQTVGRWVPACAGTTPEA